MSCRAIEIKEESLNTLQEEGLAGWAKLIALIQSEVSQHEGAATLMTNKRNNGMDNSI